MTLLLTPEVDLTLPQSPLHGIIELLMHDDSPFSRAPRQPERASDRLKKLVLSNVNCLKLPNIVDLNTSEDDTYCSRRLKNQGTDFSFKLPHQPCGTRGARLSEALESMRWATTHSARLPSTDHRPSKPSPSCVSSSDSKSCEVSVKSLRRRSLQYSTKADDQDVSSILPMRQPPARRSSCLARCA